MPGERPLWYTVPCGSHPGAGYMLHLTREGQHVLDGEQGYHEQARLAVRLVRAKEMLEAPCTVHAHQTEAQTRKVGTVGKTPGTILAVLLSRHEAISPGERTPGVLNILRRC